MDKPAQAGQKTSSILDRLSRNAGGSAGLAASAAQVKTTSVEATGGTRVSRPLTDVVITGNVAKHELVKPTRISEDQVLFYHPARPNFGTVTAKGQPIKFFNGYLLTEDKAVISFLKDNAAHFGLSVEEGPIGAKEQQKQQDSKPQEPSK